MTASSCATTASWIVHGGFTASEWISGPGSLTHVRCDAENPLAITVTLSNNIFSCLLRKHRRGGHCGAQLLKLDCRSLYLTLSTSGSTAMASRCPETEPIDYHSIDLKRHKAKRPNAKRMDGDTDLNLVGNGIAVDFNPWSPANPNGHSLMNTTLGAQVNGTRLL